MLASVISPSIVDLAGRNSVGSSGRSDRPPGGRPRTPKVSQWSVPSLNAGDISALLLTLREGTEMALVVGIVLAYLSQIGARAAQRWVWLGASAAAGVSLAFLGILNALDKEFAGTTEMLFEGSTMLLAAGFLTWMILWM